MLTLDDARDLDSGDLFASRKDEFLIPRAEGGNFPEVAYLVGNSLGLQPIKAQEFVLRQLKSWGEIAVEGHFEREKWSTYPERIEMALAELVGAHSSEIVTMNTLTVNLHLMLATFYAPTQTRYRIVLEEGAFPSDMYAIRSHVSHRGFDPSVAVVEARLGEVALGSGPSLHELLAAEGESIALVIPSAVNFQSGELFAIEQITEACHRAGAYVGWDLAHAIGNVPLRLHDWNVDFAVWCTYKYLNGGPGSIGGAFINERHLRSPELPRLEGWWGNRIETRFEMRTEIDPPDRASAWALSTPPTLAIAPIQASLDVFEDCDLHSLRAKSRRLTGFLESCLAERLVDGRASILTPSDPDRRGAQLSIYLENGDAARVVERMRFDMGVMADARGKSIVRLAPVPLYNTYEDCWRAAEALAQVSFSK